MRTSGSVAWVGSAGGLWAMQRGVAEAAQRRRHSLSILPTVRDRA